MVLFVLYVSAELENVASMKPGDGMQWHIDIKQSDGDEEKKDVYVSTDENEEIEGSKGTANFLYRWPDTKKQATIVIEEVKKLTRAITAEDSGKLVPVMGFECRGLEPIRWHPGEGFIVTTNGGKEFDSVDLTDDWTEYDDDANESIGVMNVKYEFRVHREKK